MIHPPFDFSADGINEASTESFRAFKRAMMLHRRLLMAMVAEEPMHPAQAGCLQVLAHRDGIGQSDLAEMLHVSRPSVTTMLQRMEQAGTVERKTDETDSRITRVHLTDEGRALAARMHDDFAEMLKTSIGWLPDADKHELTRILTKMSDHIESLLKERDVNAPIHHHHGHDEGATLQ